LRSYRCGSSPIPFTRLSHQQVSLFLSLPVCRRSSYLSEGGIEGMGEEPLPTQEMFSERFQNGTTVHVSLSRKIPNHQRTIWLCLCMWRVGGVKCLFRYLYIYYITFIQYIHPSPYAEVPLHLRVAGQLSGKNLPGLSSRESNSGMS
jgi:hypothetical protein